MVFVEQFTNMWSATFHSSIVFVDPKKKSNYSALNLLASALMILTSLATMSRYVSLVTDPLYMYISTPVLTVMNIWFVKNVMSWNLKRLFITEFKMDIRSEKYT